MARPEASVNQKSIKGLEKIPFYPKVGLPWERNVRPDRVGVAAHELRHALIAWRRGVPILSISTTPEGDSLGRTILGDHHSLADIQVVLAGGRVHTHLGEAEGYGSDLFKAEIIAEYYDGYSVESAISEAESIVSREDDRVLQRAAEILAALEEVPGTWLPEILSRASIEVDIEEGRNDFFINENILNIEEQETFEKTTMLENLGDQTRVKKYEGEEVVEEYLICNLCRGINSHFSNCPSIKAQDDQAILQEAE